MDQGDDDAIEEFSFLMRQRLAPITPGDWERLAIHCHSGAL